MARSIQESEEHEEPINPTGEELATRLLRRHMIAVIDAT